MSSLYISLLEDEMDCGSGVLQLTELSLTGIANSFCFGDTYIS